MPSTRPIHICTDYSLKLGIFTQFTMRLHDYSQEYHYQKLLSERRAAEIEGNMRTFVSGSLSVIDSNIPSAYIKLVTTYIVKCITVNGDKVSSMLYSEDWYMETIAKGVR